MYRNFVRQEERSDCGYAVSAMIVNYFQDLKVSIDQLKFENNINNEFLSMEDIKIMLSNYNIGSECYSAKLEEIIITKKTPVILFLKINDDLFHFVVCYEKIKDKYLIADPDKLDLKWLSKEELNAKYYGIFCITKKENIFKKEKIKLKFFNDIIIDNTNWFCIIFLVSLILNICYIVSSNFSKIYFGSFDYSSNYINLLFISFVCVFLFSSIIEIFINMLTSFVHHKIYSKVLKIYIKKISDIPNDLFEKLTIEKWILKTNSISFLIEYKLSLYTKFPTKFLLFLFAIISLLNLSYFFILFSLIQNFLIILIGKFTYNYFKTINYKNRNIKLSTSLIFNDLFFGIESLKAKNLTILFENKINKKMLANDVSLNKINLNTNLISQFVSIINKSCYFAVTYFSFFFIKSSNIKSTDLIYYFVVSGYINQFFSFLTYFLRDRSGIYNHKKEVEIIFNNFSKNKNKKINFKIKSISTINLSKQKNDHTLFTNFNFCFDKNTFIFGKSGYGKTTLLKMISGGYSDYSGKILFNDNDISNYTQSEICKSILYLGQYDYLFSDTVFENIKSFKSVDLQIFNDLQIFQILNNNNIQLDYSIKNNGSNLSKGQRQIINFLSAFFIERDFYIFDEVLSNVDRVTANNLIDKFLSYKKEKTIIYCSHDISFKSKFQSVLEIK